MQVKQIYKDLVTLVEHDVVFHIQATELSADKLGLDFYQAGLRARDPNAERDLPLDQEWGE